MPWWIWLVLAAFWLAMLIIGAVYAIRHAVRAARIASALGNQVSKRMARMTVDTDAHAPRPAAMFTRPLEEASNAYADAHAGVIRRRQARRERYARTWEQWEQFNDLPNA
ncbi:hypothetical protein [Bifidobacterium gallicum]|uniref:Putative prolyl aminopeptidase n=1 Tax=Bifidobacterium gallicum DSM 20093 = LMG 11596 TaxID=561180 RepID=D1NSL0_9BIFI|nr:hypothetical protein [Bifidobacterium gallicum]EFA23662.1 hypothetical protein BIFGAL_02767 [Bifidobacterium gallicum DSM 20093 = LMG 11596]KFI58720.1 putative prolyl aminopeptidase [Bifidobacterium gallicum DSM 20093 = LMG 11596]